jgi:uncharacterized membrane protein YcaP (DUF421 family)
MKRMEFVRLLIGPDEGDANALQLSFRAVILLLFGIICIRISGRRTFSLRSPLDIIVATVVGSNLSRAMTGKAPFFAGLTATFVLVVLHRLLAWASLRSALVARVVKFGPLPLVTDGAVDAAAMRKEGISHEDLLEALRGEQIDDLASVRLANLEGGGKISVVPTRPE